MEEGEERGREGRVRRMRREGRSNEGAESLTRDEALQVEQDAGNDLGEQGMGSHRSLLAQLLFCLSRHIEYAQQEASEPGGCGYL